MAKKPPRRPVRPAASPAASTLERRLAAFVVESAPLAASRVLEALARTFDGVDRAPDRAKAIEKTRGPARRRLEAALGRDATADAEETTPGVTSSERLARAREALLDAVDGFLQRESIAASFREEERREMVRGMLLTRATDSQLKSLFLGGQVRFDGQVFQGKGFRSLGQEAIYAAPLRLRRGASYRGSGGRWEGDVVAPLIRDLGAALAMRPEPEAVRMALSAQMGKAGPPMDGKDFHIGDMEWGVLPSAAPLSISSLTVAGLAMAFSREGRGQVAVSFIGEGGSSLGEWHEAINLCAARQLPAIFCLQNNQTALSTPVPEQSRVRVFADKAVGYGVPGLTLDGPDDTRYVDADSARNG